MSYVEKNIIIQNVSIGFYLYNAKSAVGYCAKIVFWSMIQQ